MLMSGYFFGLCVSDWLRTPPLTEPEENALVCEPTVRMMGTVEVAGSFLSAICPNHPFHLNINDCFIKRKHVYRKKMLASMSKKMYKT